LVSPTVNEAKVIAKRQYFSEIRGAAVLDDAHRRTISGATPSVALGRDFAFANGSPVTVTNFVGGSNGQLIYVRGDGNTTIQHGTNIYNRSGSDQTPALDTVVVFQNVGGIWFELGGLPALIESHLNLVA